MGRAGGLPEAVAVASELHRGTVLADGDGLDGVAVPATAEHRGARTRRRGGWVSRWAVTGVTESS